MIVIEVFSNMYLLFREGMGVIIRKHDIPGDL